MVGTLTTRRLAGFAAVLLSVTLFGCGNGPETGRTFTEEDNIANETPEAALQGHAHGPHEGHVVELGTEDYHAEVTLDDAKLLSVYILGSDQKTAKPVASENVTASLKLDGETKVVTLAPAPQEGDGEGLASKFTAADPLPESVHDAEDLHGSISFTVDGKELKGEISHEEHGHDHGHDH